MDEELVEAVRSHQAILFAGAGVSAALGLPTLAQLTNELADDLGFDPEAFVQLGEYPTLAEYYSLEKHGLGELRSRLDNLWHGPNICIGDSDVHRLIVKLEFPIVYTTNWDRWIEEAYRASEIDVHRIVGIGDLREIPQDHVQVVKFHGDFSSDESLVLTETSYLRRMDLSSPLDIKLRADALGKTLLFIGYSLGDVNTRLLLFNLSELWKKTPYPEARPRSFLVTDRPNLVQERVLREWGITSLVAEDGVDATDRLTHFLDQLAQRAFGRSGRDSSG